MAIVTDTTEQNSIPRNRDGVPLAYGLHGAPITAREAVELVEDLPRRTRFWTRIELPDGRPAVVRTVFTVFDEEALKGRVPKNHVPQLYASFAYTPEPDNRPLRLDVPHRGGRSVYRLWTYETLAHAQYGHLEAVEEIRLGLTRVLD